MPKACFVSDLHLFANRSRGDRHLEAIRDAARQSNHCVLGGDIFDFKWSTLPSMRATVDAAVDWLHDLSVRVPDCSIHFLLGNHDYYHELIDRLPDLARDVPNFDWERFYLRLGDTMFLHGDVADRKMTAARLEERRARVRHEQRGALHNRAYDMVVRTHLHAILPHAVYPKGVVARRILAYLRDIGHGPEDGIRHVYFGHTHRAVNGFHHAGVKFHNGGAPIGRARFRILELEVAGDEVQLGPQNGERRDGSA
ncbi:MAG: metallophosphoesterase [Maioricimonas sp. JB045]|uniref:metallophosphoesterase n=1 Tax=Maioricimonas sp. JC845 TaxID=3232138 RepID=UPI003458037B